jgi:hypothetical protein
MTSLTKPAKLIKILTDRHFGLGKMLAVFLILVFVLAQIAPTVSALSPEQKKLYNQNILFYDIDECAGGGGEITEGAGGPKGAAFPALSPDAMAKGINKYIAKTNPNSKMKNLGKTIVAGAKKSNVSPFLIVAIAQVESGIGDPGFGDGFNVRVANNSFGRSATASQPHVQGGDRLWYKWSSVKASVDPNAHENQNASGGGDIAAYIRNEYKSQLDAGDFDALFLKYAPEFENDTQGYIKIVKGGIDEMVKLTNKSGGFGGESFVAPTASACCPAGGAGSLSGGNNAEQAFNYFVSRDLPAVAAAGLVGNFQAESGEDLDTRADNGTHKGIAQWSSTRWAGLVESADGNEYDLRAQLDYVMEELNGSYKSSVLNPLKNAKDSNEAAEIVFTYYEAPGDDTLPIRQANARDLMNKLSGGSVTASAGSCSGAVGDANMGKTITIDTPGKFITLPGKYVCAGGNAKIDSRIAAAVAYISTKYDSCVTSGLEDGHKSHGAGLAVDMIPKNGNSKDAWVNSVEAAARDIGWFGDSATDPKGSQKGCSNYSGDGQCMHAVYPDKFPEWLRWMGHNGAIRHGDPWHLYGGTGPHLHIGWDTPNGDGVSSTVIPEPRESIYTFPAPVPDDLRGLAD